MLPIRGQYYRAYVNQMPRRRSAPVLRRSKPRRCFRYPIFRASFRFHRCCARGRAHSGLVAHSATFPGNAPPKSNAPNSGTILSSICKPNASTAERACPQAQQATTVLPLSNFSGLFPLSPLLRPRTGALRTGSPFSDLPRKRATEIKCSQFGDNIIEHM